MVDLFNKVKEQDPFTFFIISRTWNRNVVSITANTQSNEICKKNPVNPYWIMYEKNPNGNIVESLTFCENKLGYGYKLIETNWPYFTITINAVPSIKAKCNSNTFECMVVVDEIEIRLLEVRVVCSETLFGLYPSVDFILIKGIDNNENYIEKRIQS